MRLSLDLCSVESSCGEEEKARIMANVTRLFEAGGDPRAPGAEPGLTTKSERAAVGAASSAWVEMLKKSQSGDPVQGTSAASDESSHIYCRSIVIIGYCDTVGVWAYGKSIK